MSDPARPRLPPGQIDDAPWHALGPSTWRVGDRVVKHLPDARKHRQALTFHTELAPRLRAAGHGTARLLHTTDDALVLRLAPGEPVSRGLDPSVPRPAVLEAAGRWLRALHDLRPVPPDPLPLEEAVRRRWAGILPGLPDDLRQTLEARIDVSVLAGIERVWCHRDVHPRNWLWDGERLTVVDVEHARPDLGAIDLVRTPGRAVLLDSYGHVEERVLEQALLLDAAGAIAWGRRHGEEAFVREGLSRLEGAL